MTPKIIKSEDLMGVASAIKYLQTRLEIAGDAHTRAGAVAKSLQVQLDIAVEALKEIAISDIDATKNDGVVIAKKTLRALEKHRES